MISGNSSTTAAQAVLTPVVELSGSLFRITADARKYDGLETLLEDGTVHNYYKDAAGKLIVIAETPEAAKKLTSLSASSSSSRQGILGKIKDLFIPPNLKENCASEYIPFRTTTIGIDRCGSILAFMNARIGLDAINIALGNSEKAALAGAAAALLYNATSMAASFLAERGDINPKRANLISGICGSVATVGTPGYAGCHTSTEN